MDALHLRPTLMDVDKDIHAKASALVYAERQRQEMLREQGKFGATPATAGLGALSDHQFIAILVEEVGEVCRAVNDCASRRHLKSEITQVAAVAMVRLERMVAEEEPWRDPAVATP